MMKLLAAILVTMASLTSSRIVKLTINASNPSVTFQTTNYPRTHNAREKCTWVVSAPGNVYQLYVTYDLNIIDRGHCSSARFIYYNYDEEHIRCGIEKRSINIKGSTGIFYFRSSMCINFHYSGISCTVSYKPEEISTSTTPVDPFCTCGVKVWERIVGGNETTPNEYPWQAMLMNKSSGVLFCGGSVIAQQWLLTAVHCVKNKTSSSILVGLGQHNYENYESLAQYFEVTDIIKHQHYDQESKINNDIALLKLKEPVTFNRVISPICLPFNYKHYDFTDHRGISTGWGRTIAGDARNRSKILKQIEQKIIMPFKCTILDGYKWIPRQITENMICALAQNGFTTKGDSGGPLAWKSDSSKLYFQLGVASFGPEGNIQNVPDVFARVSQFVDWIVEKTQTRDEFCVKI